MTVRKPAYLDFTTYFIYNESCMVKLKKIGIVAGEKWFKLITQQKSL